MPTQRRIQDLKKEGAQVAQGLAPNIFLANLGDFLNNLAQKGVGVRPPLDPRLLHIYMFIKHLSGHFF